MGVSGPVSLEEAGALPPGAALVVCLVVDGAGRGCLGAGQPLDAIALSGFGAGAHTVQAELRPARRGA